MKAILILVDGMRPDAIADISEAKAVLRESAYTMEAKTVFPSVTLPCHMSLFHSVDPSRHGTTTNTYMPQVRPIAGLCEVLKTAGKKSAFFYNWEELRDLSRPGSLAKSFYFSGHVQGYEAANACITRQALHDIEAYDLDFSFIYMGWSDAAGHAFGWMSDEYMRAVHESWKSIAEIVKRYGKEYQIIITADHGGHDRTHGTERNEDMLIPLILHGSCFKKGQIAGEISIKDIAPTVSALLGVQPDKEWEGKSLL